MPTNQSDRIEKAREYFLSHTRKGLDYLVSSELCIQLLADYADEQTAALEKRVGELEDVLKAWQGWFNGPYAEGVSYINPPLNMTEEVLSKPERQVDDPKQT